MASCSVVILPTSSHWVGMLKVARCACLFLLTSISGGSSTDVFVLPRAQIGHRQPLLAFEPRDPAPFHGTYISLSATKALSSTSIQWCSDALPGDAQKAIFLNKA